MAAPETIPPADLAALDDRQLAEFTSRQLDHLDSMLHDIDRRTRPLEALLPLLPRALALLDPMGEARRARRGRRAARRAAAESGHTRELEDEYGVPHGQ